jgi:hypothetical protein
MKITGKVITLILLFIASGCVERVTDFDDSEIIFYNTFLRGRISGTLTLSNSPYQAADHLFVDSLQSLIIEPGVKINFEKGVTLTVKGNLIAKGTKDEPISLTAFDSTWGGIRIVNSILSELKFCLINKVDLTGTEENGAIEISNSAVNLSNNFIEDNKAYNGGGVFLFNSSAEIMNNIFKNNYSAIWGGGLFAEESMVEIYNNTFFNNRSGNSGGGVLIYNPSGSIIQNNIFYKNYSRSGDPRIAVINNNGLLDTAYNFLWFGNLNPGFISENDFHLAPGSSCIDSGNPHSSFNDTDGSRNDRGAYGGPLGNW